MQKAGSAREDRMIQSLLIWDRFDTAAGISRQISVNLECPVIYSVSMLESRYRKHAPQPSSLLLATNNVGWLVFAEEHVPEPPSTACRSHFTSFSQLTSNLCKIMLRVTLPNVSRSFSTKKELRFEMARPESRLNSNRESMEDHRRGHGEKNIYSYWIMRKLKEEWNDITPELCHKSVTSCGRRCARVVQSKGLYSAY